MSLISDEATTMIYTNVLHKGGMELIVRSTIMQPNHQNPSLKQEVLSSFIKMM
jgi:hypothetical protein